MPQKKLHIELLHVLQGHAGAIYTLYQADKDAHHQFLSASGDGMVVQWDLNAPDSGQLLAKVPTNIFSLAVVPHQPLLLIGQLQGGIHVVNVDDKKEIKHLSLHKKGVFDIQFLDAKHWLAAGGDGKLSLWNSDFELLTQLQIASDSVRSIERSPNGKHLALGCSDNHTYIFGIEEKEGKYSFHELYRLKEHENSVFSLRYSPDGKYLLSGSRDARLCVWDVEKNYELWRPINAHLYTINDIVFSPDGGMIATAGRDKTIKLWEAESFELLKVISPEKMDAHHNSVNKLLWTEHNNWLVSAGDDRTIRIWNIIED